MHGRPPPIDRRCGGAGPHARPRARRPHSRAPSRSGDRMSTERVGVVVVTHGQLATELLNAAEMIVGELPQCAAVSIGWHDDVEVARAAIDQAIRRVDKGRGVLVLTDMFGGTPSNLGLSFLEAG